MISFLSFSDVFNLSPYRKSPRRHVYFWRKLTPHKLVSCTADGVHWCRLVEQCASRYRKVDMAATKASTTSPFAVLALLRALEGTPIIHHPRCNAAMCHRSTSVEVASSERRCVLELVGNWVCRPQAPIAAGAASPGLRWDGGTAQARRWQQQEVEATCERLWDPL